MNTGVSFRPFRVLCDYSIFLLGGALVAVIWACVSPTTYTTFKHFDFSVMWGGVVHGGGHGSLWSIEFLANNSVMAFFFLLAAKEVFEAVWLKDGDLSSWKRAGMPLIATMGGILGPAGLYLLGAFFAGKFALLYQGCAVPCATDIAFSYLVARIVFGPGHPAITFLLLLAIADDAAGMLIIAAFFPQGDLHVWWLVLCLAAVATGFVMRAAGVMHWLWYVLIPGAMSWWGLHLAGFHAALGLVPIVITMPHADSDMGLFMKSELGRHDTLNEMEHSLKDVVEFGLLLFGLANAGVPGIWQSVGLATFLVAGGLMIGKPLGILVFTWIGERWFGLTLPEKTSYRHILLLGCVAGFGFTVALFMVPASLGGHPVEVQAAAKLGALSSFLVFGIAPLAGWLLGVRKQTREEAVVSPSDSSEVTVSCV